MNAKLPSRFLRKLDIYQQIRKGQGLAKHKHLWPQEAAFLKWAYEAGHQHLNSFISYEDFKMVLGRELGKPKEDLSEVEETLGNLYFKSFISVRKSDDVNPPTAAVEQKFSNGYSYRATPLGLEVGEVVSEMHDGRSFKYRAWLWTWWLLATLGSLTIIATAVKSVEPAVTRLIETISPIISGIDKPNVATVWLVFFFVFAILAASEYRLYKKGLGLQKTMVGFSDLNAAGDYDKAQIEKTAKSSHKAGFISYTLAAFTALASIFFI